MEEAKSRRSFRLVVPAWALALVILLSGLAIAAFLLVFLNSQSMKANQSAFDGAAEGATQSFLAEMSLSTSSIELVAGLFRADLNVSLEQFITFSTPVLARGTLALVYYAQVIANADQNATVAHLHTVYDNARILPDYIATTQPNPGRVPPVLRVPDDTNRPQYVVNFYVNPPVNQNVGAVLLNANATKFQTIVESTDSAEIRTAELLRIPFEDGLAYGTQYFVPIYTANNSTDPTGASLSLEERRAAISGFTISMFSIPKVVEQAFITDVTKDYSIYVYQIASDGQKTLVHAILPGGESINIFVTHELEGKPLPVVDRSKYIFTRDVSVLDQQWEILFVDTTDHSYDSAAIVVFILVVLFTFVAVFLVYMYVRMHKLAETTANLLAHLSVLYESAPVGMAYVGRDRKFHNINQQAAALNGADAPEHIGKDMTEVGQGPFSEVTRERVEYVLTTGERISDAEVIISKTPEGHLHSSSINAVDVSECAVTINDDNTHHTETGIEMEVLAAEGETAIGVSDSDDLPPPEKSTYLMSFYPVYLHTYAPGSRTEMPLPDGVSVVVKDVTDLSKERDTANDLSLSKTLFLARMSHEIRTPIGGILGCIELLMDGSMETLSAEQESLVVIIRHSAKLLLALIDDILDLSKMEADHVTLEKLPMMLVDQVLSSIDMCKVEKGVELAAFVEPGTETVSVLGDATRIAQIVYNIASNALKFTPSGHVFVRLSSRRSKTESDVIVYTIRVEDTGIGIAKEKLSQVFDTFVQEKEGHNRIHGGVGLGLSIVSRLVKLMDGEVGLESEPGEGTAMTVTLPLRISEDKGTQGASGASPALGLSRPTRGSVAVHSARLKSLASTIVRGRSVLVAIKEHAHMAAMCHEFLNGGGASRVDSASTAEELHDCVRRDGLQYALAVIDANFMAEYDVLVAGRNPTQRAGRVPLARHDFSPSALLFWKVHPTQRRNVKMMLSQTGFNSILSHPSELVPAYLLCRAAQTLEEAALFADDACTPVSPRSLRVPVGRASRVSLQTTRSSTSLLKHNISDTTQDALSLALQAPIKSASHATLSVVSTSSGHDEEERIRVLFVEDNLVNQRVIVTMLKKLLPHADIVVADNGLKALGCFDEAVAANRLFDIVFMDVQMPVMDGAEATRCIRTRESMGSLQRTPVIALTAHAMASDRDACLIAGMDEYITKPTSMEMLKRSLTYFGFTVRSVPDVGKEKAKSGKKKKKKEKACVEEKAQVNVGSLADETHGEKALLLRLSQDDGDAGVHETLL